MRRLISYFLLLVPSLLVASGGADALMKALPKGAIEDGSAPKAMLEGGVNLSDPFLVQFYSSWSQQRNLPYEVNQWALHILKGNQEQAAHLWSVVSRKIPSSFERAAQTAQLYLLWKLGVAQTFFDQWTEKLRSTNYRRSSAAKSLEQSLIASVDSFLLDNAISLTSAQKKMIASLNPSQSYVWANLQAYAYLREGKKAEKLLSLLPNNNKLKIPLIQTVVLALAKRNEIDKAAKILKGELEPAIETSKDVKSLASYYLQIARLLYQVGALEGAEQFYTKVPTGTDEYLNAREELLWVWLRQGKRKQVRGTLASFDTGLFEDKFAPDVYVVRAISNLKLCYYDKAKQDINEFSRDYSEWAKRIDEGIEKSSPKGLSSAGFFVDLAKRSVATREEETKKLQTLFEGSVEAALPAVGRQAYWERAKTTLQNKLEASRQQLAYEYQMRWKNRKQVLAEAIRKMNFVKVELLSQMQRYAGESTLATSKQKRVALVTNEEEQNFKFDGVVWPDELFKIQSLAQAKCLGGE